MRVLSYPLRSVLSFRVASTIGALTICFSSALVFAADSPLTVIRITVEQVIAVLQDPAHQGTAHRLERFAQVRAIVLPRFDTQEMAKRTLSLHWRTRTSQEQVEFTQLFTDLVEKSYRPSIPLIC